MVRDARRDEAGELSAYVWTTRADRPGRMKGEGMTKDELLKILRDCAKSDDPEIAHGDADEALLKFINDPQISAAFDLIEKWYA